LKQPSYRIPNNYLIDIDRNGAAGRRLDAGGVGIIGESIFLYVRVCDLGQFQRNGIRSGTGIAQAGHAAATDKIGIIRLAGKFGMRIRGVIHFKDNYARVLHVEVTEQESVPA